MCDCVSAPATSFKMGFKRNRKAKTGRNKGKKMRDPNSKGTEKEGFDVETTAEPALPEESSSAPASTPMSEPAPAPAPPAPAPAVEEAAAAAAPAPAPAPAPAEAATEETESAATPKSAPEPSAEPAAEVSAEPAPEPAMPEPVPAAASPAVAAPAPAVANPIPTPASVSASSGAGFFCFNPPFAIPATPIILPKTTSNKEDKENDKEGKLVAARNEENAKVSGMNDDGSSDKRRQYTADQWSPQNPDGKKKYDRKFLMELRSDPQSQKKPDGLPEIEVVLKDGNKKAMQNNFTNEFSPAGFISSRGSRGPPPKRNSQQGNKPKPGKPPVVHLSLSLREDVKLHESENAWKPGILVPNQDESDAKTQDLNKKVRGILNKLTPEKFDKLVGQVQNLPIDTPEKLTGVIDLVFDKAVDEPSFSVAYAKMCSELRTKDVQGASFRKILITRCQQEFEKNKEAELAQREIKLKEIEKQPDPEKKKELTLMYEEEERKVRMKSVGNIRFIGELYKLGMLTGAIMLRCVSALLQKEDEESYECLCKLLTTIGKKLEQELGDVLGPFFDKMEDLADKKRRGRNVSSRVRFMLQDCIDLRSHKWIPRRDDSNPKTMTEISKEAERETLETNLLLSQPNTPRKDDRGRMGGRGMDSRGGRGGSMASDNDGWKTAAPRSRPIDVSKLSKGIILQPESSTTLGSPSTFSKWGVGSGSSATRDPKSLRPNVISSNPYGALSEKPMFNNADRKTPLSGPASKDRSMGGERGPSSRSSSQHRMGSQPASRDSSVARGKLEDERRNRVPTPSSLTDSSPSDDQPSGEARGEGPVCKIKRVEDPAELERFTKNIFLEFQGHKNMEEAQLAVMDYFDWTNIGAFNREILTLTLDHSQGHQLVSQFLAHLIKVNYMKKEHFFSGFAEFLELCPDLIIDYPKLWIHVGDLIGHFLLTEAVTFKDLAEPMKVLKGSKDAGLLLKNIIQVLVKERGPSWIRDHWEKCGVTWSDFLAAEDVSDFVKENKFESFSGGAQASRSEMTQAEIQAKILELLRSEVSFDAVQEWIQCNVGDRTKEPAFIRALMTAICKNAIIEAQSNKLTLNDVKLRQDKLLLRYVDNKEDLELQCLYAVQALIMQLDYPQGLILSIFNTLWEDNLISTEAFLAWFESNDPQESEGRGVCKKSLASFQTLLAEAEVDEEEEHP